MDESKFLKYSKLGNVLLGPGCELFLKEIQKELPELIIHREKTGEKFADWVIPPAWTNNGGYIKSECGSFTLDLGDHPLRLMQYSNPLDVHIHSDHILNYCYTSEESPDSIPYITNYYGNKSGICLTKSELGKILSLKTNLHIKIDTSFQDDFLYYGEIVFQGESDIEVLISSYICHPWMANNELSGPLLWIEVVKYLKSIERKYTYRLVLTPETLGSIVYCVKNESTLKQKVLCGINLTCIGDERGYGMIETPSRNTMIDRIIKRSLSNKPNATIYSWLNRGSDERQYNSPRMNLNVVTICRSKFGNFPEYHTSADKYGVTVTENGMKQSLDWLIEILWLLENNVKYSVNHLGEPHMSKYNLYPEVSISSQPKNRTMMDFISLCDGRDLLSIGEYLDLDIKELKRLADELKLHKIISVLD